MKYHSCPYIENFFLVFGGRFDDGTECMKLCCENFIGIPQIPFARNAQESVKNFQRLRSQIIIESKRLAMTDSELSDERIFSAGCAKCVDFQLKDFMKSDNLIHYINLSMYPAPCQSKCVYCTVYKGAAGTFDETDVTKGYDKVFEIVDYLDRTNLIATDATWQVSSGEITIHPFKDKIYELVDNRAAVFYTNCFIYDEKIAHNLSSNPCSAINLSIDSGTAETWFKVKGVDNFETVKANLYKYFNSSVRSGQIQLKYIILPDINDNLDDYSSVIEIMKLFQIKHISISRNTQTKYAEDAEKRNKSIMTIPHFVAMLQENGMSFSMQFAFTPDERKRVTAYANELLQTEYK